MGRLKEISRNVHVDEWIVRKGWEKWLLLTSDNHIDNPKHDKELMTKHFDQALERDADIYIFGDLFDLMQGKFDPRSNKGEFHDRVHEIVRTEDKPYLDAVVQYGAEYLKPYAKNIRLITPGNHETNIAARRETDVLDSLVTLMNHDGANICKGGYAGWLRFHAQYGEDGGRASIRLHYFHGAGGAAPRTKGTLRVDLDSGRFPNANIIVHGHTHQKWQMKVLQEMLNKGDTIVEQPQYHICCGHYKDSIQDGHTGWAVERDFKRTPRGGWWVHVTYDTRASHRGGNRFIIEIIEAD